jgi:hypothetical protein
MQHITRLQCYDVMIGRDLFHSFRKFGRTLKENLDQMLISSQAVCSLMHWRDTRGRCSSNWTSLTTLSALMLRAGVKFVFTLHSKMLCCNTWTIVLDSIWAASPLHPSACVLYLSAQYRLPPLLIFLEHSSQGKSKLRVAVRPFSLIQCQVFEGVCSI